MENKIKKKIKDENGSYWYVQREKYFFDEVKSPVLRVEVLKGNNLSEEFLEIIINSKT